MHPKLYNAISAAFVVTLCTLGGILFAFGRSHVMAEQHMIRLPYIEALPFLGAGLMWLTAAVLFILAYRRRPRAQIPH